MIVVPSLEDVAVILAELGQRVRTGADGVAVELFLADLFKIGGRQQLAAVVADVIFEVGVRGVGDDIDGEIVHNDDFLDESPLLIERDVADGMADAVDIPLDGFGVNRLAIMEGRAFAQVEAPGGGVDIFPGCAPPAGRSRCRQRRARSGSRNTG